MIGFRGKLKKQKKYSQEKNHREFYAALNAVYGPRPRISHQIRSIEGGLLSSTEDTNKRWIEHFKNLLNQPCHYHQDIGGLQPISRDTDNNAAMFNCWCTNKRS